MKKFVSLFCVFILLFLSSCVQEDLIDVYVFVDRFNNLKLFEKLSEDQFYATENSGEISFDFLIDSKFLLSVVSDENTQKIKRCFVTYEYENNNMSLDSQTKDAFFTLCLSTISSYTDCSIKEAEEIMKKIGFDKEALLSNPKNRSCTYGFNSYHFFFNKFGFSFTVESTRLNEPDPTDPRLQ